jgi:hypothetical protein
MPRFNIDIDGDRLQRFKELALKRRTPMSQIARDLLYNHIEEQTATPTTTTTTISIISHGISTNTIPTAEEEKELSPEDEQALIIKNLVKATKDASEVIACMEVGEFASEIKGLVIERIYGYRNADYRRRVQNKAVTNDSRRKKMLRHDESMLMPQQQASTGYLHKN